MTKEFDVMSNQHNYEEFKKIIKKNVSDKVNMLEPIYVERTDNWESKEELFESMAKDIGDVDLYLINPGIGRDDIAIEFALRYKKPIALIPLTLNFYSMTTLGAALSSRDCEFYAASSWDEMNKIFNVLRVRKVLQKTNVLLATRFNTNCSFAGVDTFTNLDMVTQKLGAKFRVINLHELLDQMTPAEPGGNRTTPGRETPDLTKEEMAEANIMADELLKGSIDTDLDKSYLVNSLIAYLTVKKNLELTDCNGFTVPCPDACSTRRLNEMKFTFCLAHSLLNEQGIPSACEYDVDAVLTMMMLINISGKAPYMGNTSILPYNDGDLHMLWRVEESDFAGIDDRSNLAYSEHAVPNRKFHGITEKATEYGLKHFAVDQGFGAVLRHDFKKDVGQTITLARFSPDATKLFVANGTIVGGGGFNYNNCNNHVIFRVKDQKDFFKKQTLFGNHVPLVYGDYSEELIMLAETLGLEVVRA